MTFKYFKDNEDRLMFTLFYNFRIREIIIIKTNKEIKKVKQTLLA